MSAAKRFLTVMLRLLTGLAALLALALTIAWNWRPGLDELRAHRAPMVAIPDGAVTVRWFGVSAVLISDGKHVLLIDPFFTRPAGLLSLVSNRAIAPDEGLIARSLDAAGVINLDAVLVSHSHFDHSMDAGVVAQRTGAQLLGSGSTANIGRGAGLTEDRIRAIVPGEPMKVGSFTVTFLRSRHGGATKGWPGGDITQALTAPATRLDYRQGGTYSILVQHPRGTVLHHGSAGYEEDALRSVKADVVLLGIAMVDDAAAYLRAVPERVGAKRLVPLHWDDFTRPLDQPLRPFPAVLVRPDKFFAALRQRPQLQVQTLEPGQPLVLF